MSNLYIHCRSRSYHSLINDSTAPSTAKDKSL